MSDYFGMFPTFMETIAPERQSFRAHLEALLPDDDLPTPLELAREKRQRLDALRYTGKKPIEEIQAIADERNERARRAGSSIRWRVLNDGTLGLE